MKNSEGFVTIAFGHKYLKLAQNFALSAKRFGYPTILLWGNLEQQDRDFSLFADAHYIEKLKTVNREYPEKFWEYKKFVRDYSTQYDKVAYVDADSLVIKNPKYIFDPVIPNGIHTPMADALKDNSQWGCPKPFTTKELRDEYSKYPAFPLKPLNGGFFIWDNDIEMSKKWFTVVEKLFHDLSIKFKGRPVRDELVFSLAYNILDLDNMASNSSIGIWDAHFPTVDIANEKIFFYKGGHWNNRSFSPCIAHFGGSNCSKSLYKNCIKWLKGNVDEELVQDGLNGEN
jgi:hypothetical protein